MQLVILSCPKVHYRPTILPSTPPSADFYSKRASSSYFVNWFCFSNKRLSGSLSLYRRFSNLDGYCFVKGASEISSFRSGLCNLSKRISESVDVCKSHSNLSGIRCEGVFVEERDDGFYMRRCVELARKAVGCTSPNPMVGCVIVKNGEIVGEWFHPKAGQPHAEIHGHELSIQFAELEISSLAWSKKDGIVPAVQLRLLDSSLIVLYLVSIQAAADHDHLFLWCFRSCIMQFTQDPISFNLALGNHWRSFMFLVLELQPDHC